MGEASQIRFTRGTMKATWRPSRSGGGGGVGCADGQDRRAVWTSATNGLDERDQCLGGFEREPSQRISSHGRTRPLMPARRFAISVRCGAGRRRVGVRIDIAALSTGFDRRAGPLRLTRGWPELFLRACRKVGDGEPRTRLERGTRAWQQKRLIRRLARAERERRLVDDRGRVGAVLGGVVGRLSYHRWCRRRST
jgi:hypothetical protein